MSLARRIRRALSNLAALALGLLLIEALLQAGAWGLSASRRDGGEWLAGSRRILCVGDSNTYGLYLEPEQSWPLRLEALWNERPGAAPIDVMNLGYPGTSSSQVRRDLPRMLDAFRPDLVLVMVGVNDFWSHPVPVGPEADGRGLVRRFLERHSRLYRLAWAVQRALVSLGEEESEIRLRTPVADRDRLARNLRTGVARTLERGGVAFDRSVQGPAPARRRVERELAVHLRAIADGLSRRGVPAMFLTYPSRAGRYAAANRILREAAADASLPLVDVAAAFSRLCPAEPCPEWLFPDHHATAKGNRRVAEIVVRAIAP